MRYTGGVAGRLSEKSWLASVPAMGIAATADNRSEALRLARREYERLHSQCDAARDLVIVDGPPMEERT